jgi:5-methylcytosine-specific restriction endonuclease McrA
VFTKNTTKIVKAINKEVLDFPYIPIEFPIHGYIVADCSGIDKHLVIIYNRHMAELDFEQQLRAGFREMGRIMSSPEWKAQYGNSINHGTSQGYQHCKKTLEGPCQPCIKAMKKYGKEYRSRKEVKERLYSYNRSDRKKTNKSRFERYLKRGFNPESNYFTANTVLAEYGTNCHLCNRPIDLNAPRKSGADGWELSLHIDHVIPLSKGGDDTLQNVRPAHGQCNLFKSAKIQGIE